MSELLEMAVLGGLTINRGGAPVSGFASRKAEALLVYLACARRPLSREVLANLLWDERSQTRALANLRVLLTSLRQHLDAHIIVDRQTVAVNQETSWLDAAELEQQLAAARERERREGRLSGAVAAQLEGALALYRGRFLEGFYIRDSRGFEEWVALQQESLQRQVIEALSDLMNFFLDRGEYTTAIKHASRLLSLDPFYEEAHRQLMRALALTGQRHTALAQYETCRRILADELGVEPAAETTALYEQIRDKETWGQGEREKAHVVRFSRPHNLPVQLTPFLGREQELAQIAECLAQPAYRLLTLVGPGGVGKTRLAIQAAAAHARAFRDGVCFVPLESVNAAEFLVPAIVTALDLPVSDQSPPKVQLLNYLRERHILLVLDNFEQLLEGTDLLLETLRVAPHVVMLVTSRERLRLQAETLFRIQGLPFPPSDAEANVAGFGAVQLFLDRARRVDKGFTLSAQTATGVIRVCRLVEGIPLALELAAAWVQELDCEAIARGIERSLDFLTTNMRDVPARHRSLRAVFEHSWALLSASQQAVLRRLSVFRGGFSGDAAAHVAHATPAVLTALVDKSLLRVTPAGRYDLHELVRQYAAEKLAQLPDEVARAHNRHCGYYTTFLEQREADLRGKWQVEARRAIDADIDNVRAAWDRAVTRRRTDSIGRCLEGLYRFYLASGRLQDGFNAFEQAARRLPTRDEAGALWDETEELTYWRARVRWANFAFDLGRFEQASALIEECVPALSGLGTPGELVPALNCLGAVRIEQGRYAEAQAILEEGLALARQVDDRAGQIVLLQHLGAVAFDHEAYDQAERYHRERLAIAREVGDQTNIAYAINHLGAVAYMLGRYREARDHYQEGLQIWEALGDRWGMCQAHANLGEVACDLGDCLTAANHLHMALKLATDLGATASVLYVLFALARLLAHEGERERAVELLEFVMHHPACGISTKNQAQPVLSELIAQLPRELVAAAQARGRVRTLEELLLNLSGRGFFDDSP